MDVVIWVWLGAFAVMVLLTPEVFGGYWRTCKRLHRRR